jgi:hypothetical protein
MNVDDLTAKIKPYGGADARPPFIFDKSEWNEQSLNIVSRQVCAADVYGEAGVCLFRVEHNLQWPVA